jgi:hypothetical protein
MTYDVVALSGNDQHVQIFQSVEEIFPGTTSLLETNIGEPSAIIAGWGNCKVPNCGCSRYSGYGQEACGNCGHPFGSHY